MRLRGGAGSSDRLGNRLPLRDRPCRFWAGGTGFPGASDGAPHPWEAVYQEWRKKNEYLVSEDTYWLELSAID